jgi:hypothetical protein
VYGCFTLLLQFRLCVYIIAVIYSYIRLNLAQYRRITVGKRRGAVEVKRQALITMKQDVYVGFEVLTAASMKMAVFWVVAPFSLVEVYRCFRGTCYRYHQFAMMMEAASTSETSVNFCQTTRRYNPEGQLS